MIPGWWKHVAIYVGEGQVVEAVEPLVRTVAVADFVAGRGAGPKILGKDYVRLLRPTFATAAEAALAAGAARTLIGKPYDVMFEYDPDRTRNPAFYCAEVPWWSYDLVFRSAGKISSFEPRETLGELTITAQDYDDAIAKWSVCCSSAEAPKRPTC